MFTRRIVVSGQSKCIRVRRMQTRQKVGEEERPLLNLLRMNTLQRTADLGLKEG